MSGRLKIRRLPGRRLDTINVRLRRFFRRGRSDTVATGPASNAT